MNRLATVLYIRSTLASSRADLPANQVSRAGNGPTSPPDETAQSSGTTGEPTEKAQASQDETVHFTSRLEMPPSDPALQLEKPDHPMPAVSNPPLQS
jgi:hypothetical protein